MKPRANEAAPVRVEPVTEPASTPGRFELTLHKPPLGWYPKPTVVVDGVAQPAQWGRRSWKVPGMETVQVNIFLFNRAWKFGAVDFDVEPGEPGAACAYSYRAPWLPWGRGRLAVGSAPQRFQP